MSRLRIAAALGALWGLAAGLAGCRKEGAPYACECEWLTDYDDAAKQAVRVCAASDQEALSVARGCAQLATPAPVQSCSCGKDPQAPPVCREGCRD